MLGTAVIEIFLLPILLSASGQISLVTVITNLLVLPTLPVVMGFGFVATLSGYVHSMLALPLVALSNLMLEYIWAITNFFANISVRCFSFSNAGVVGVRNVFGTRFLVVEITEIRDAKKPRKKVVQLFLQLRSHRLT